MRRRKNGRRIRVKERSKRKVIARIEIKVDSEAEIEEKQERKR